MPVKIFIWSSLLKKNVGIWGITALPNGKFILAGTSDRGIHIVNNDGIFEKTISRETDEEGPFNVTYIKDNEVAISTASGINIVNIQSNSIVENINTN